MNSDDSYSQIRSVSMIRLHSTGLNDACILSNILSTVLCKGKWRICKVYIYLLRMLGRPEEAFRLSQMADSLFCTGRYPPCAEILKVWKLITLLYEEAELTGIAHRHRGMKQIYWLRWLLQVSVTPVRSSDVPDTYHISAPESPAVIPNAPTDNPLQTDQISYRSAHWQKRSP